MSRTLRDYILHLFVHTPLERPLFQMRSVVDNWRALKTPELIGIYKEPAAIRRLLDTVITDGMNCIDVGAHLGRYLSRFLRLSPSGKHVGVEPTPHKVRWLEKKFPECTIIPYALGEDVEEKAQLFIRETESGVSSLRSKATHSLKETSESLMDVEVRRLDDVLDPEVSYDFLEINVVGAELSALKGGTNFLKRCKPMILFGAAEDSLKAFDHTPGDMYDFLTELGYGIHVVAEFLEGLPPLTRDAFLDGVQYPFKAFNFFALHEDAPRRSPEGC